jgi:AcrR family transcriptional regulator
LDEATVGITERRERDRAEIRGKILDAARRLFATEGYDRVTMRGVAEAIEYSPTTIYHHFEDKDDLVAALCECDFAGLFNALIGRPAPADPIDEIRQLGLAYVRFGLDHPNHYRFMFMTAGKAEHPKESDPGHQAFELLRSAVERAIVAGRFRPGDPATAAQVLWAAIHGAVALLITLEPHHWPAPPAADLTEQAVENGIRGFLASPPAGTEPTAR